MPPRLMSLNKTYRNEALMTKIYLLLFSSRLLTGSFSYAETQRTVSCELIYSKSSIDGAYEAFFRGNNVLISSKQVSDENHGFVMTAQLTRECPRGIGAQCSSDSELMVTVTHGESSSLINVKLENTANFKRYSTALTVGPEQGLVNCDQNLN